jgi:hypothetical protein
VYSENRTKCIHYTSKTHIYLFYVRADDVYILLLLLLLLLIVFNPWPVWAGARAQSGNRYGSGTLHPGQVLRGSLPLLSPLYIYIYIAKECLAGY